VITPGIHDLPPEVYHADPCPEPSLSASIARRLIRQSPMHARYHHPRLNPDRPHDDASDASDAGTILHKLLLGRGADIVPVEADDWRTKAAKEARDEARANGHTPVLAGKLAALHVAAIDARRQIEQHPDARLLFEPGRAEHAMIWREGPTWCRSLVDWMPDDPTLPLLDLKTTGMSAAPADWERRLASTYALQAAFYERGARALGRRSRHPMLFIVIEQDAPHGVSVMAADPSLQAIADAEVGRALNLWEQCLRTKEWPGYPLQTAYVAAKPWQIDALELDAAQ
jgi:hypothetical protein